MRRIAFAGAVLVIGLLPVASAAAAGAAPTYVTSDPQDGATLDSAPSAVSVTFSEPLDPSSTLQVFDQCGRAVDDGDEQVLGSRIEVGLAQTPAGHYTAVYLAKGFGGATGETKGSFSFHVTSGADCDGGHGGHGGHGEGGNGEEGPGHGGEHGHGGGGDEHANGGHDGHAGDDGAGHMSDDGHSTSHEADGHGDGDHANSGHGDGDAHGKDGHHGKRHGDHHGGDRSPGGEGGGLGDLAAGRGGAGLAPTSTSVLIALGLSIALGALGGWVLRVSAGG